jgi:hypothetical protein
MTKASISRNIEVFNDLYSILCTMQNAGATGAPPLTIIQPYFYPLTAKCRGIKAYRDLVHP